MATGKARVQERRVSVQATIEKIEAILARYMAGELVLVGIVTVDVGGDGCAIAMVNDRQDATPANQGHMMVAEGATADLYRAFGEIEEIMRGEGGLS